MNHPLSMLSALTAGTLTLYASLAAGDYAHERSRSRPDVAPVDHALYRDECSGCHMAYQPGLLPARAWGEIMTASALTEHYGDDASLGEAGRGAIAEYLEGHAADRAKRYRSRAFAVPARSGKTIGDGALPRITATRYFLHEHDEIPDRMVGGNPDVLSWSRCDACHRRADEGVYNEHQVDIPGFGRWED